MRWQAKHVRDLFDSIYRGYPVGSLLFFRAKAKAALLGFGPKQIDAKEKDDAFFVLDGQQRINALAGALLHPDPRPRGGIFALWFDLETEEFFHPRRANPEPTWLPLNVVMDAVQLHTWLSDALLKERPDLARRAFELGKVLREYALPVYVVDRASDDALRTVFKRVNTGGVHMQEHEVFDALFSTSEPRPLANACRRLAEETGFGTLEPKLLLRTMKGVTDQNLRLSFAEGEGAAREVPADAVARTEAAFRRSIEFLIEDAGVPHIKLLPYKLPLLVLPRLFDRHPHPPPRARELLGRWVWRGALSGVHADTSDATLHELWGHIEGRDLFHAVGRLLDTVPANPAAPAASALWNGHSAQTKSCAVALAALGPKRPTTGDVVSTEELQHLLDEREPGEVYLDLASERHSSVAMAALVVDRAQVRELVSAGPSVLASHGIDDLAAEKLRSGNHECFAQRRAQVLQAHFDRFFSARTDCTDGDRPPINELVRRVDGLLKAHESA
jgi:hypothetical protein